MSTKAVNAVVSVDGNYVVAQTQASLERTENISERNKKEDKAWGATGQNLKEWDVSLATIFQESTGDNPVGADGAVSLDIGTDTVQEVQSLEVTFTNDLTQTGDISDPLWRSVRVPGKNMEISLTGDYVDPNLANGAAYSTLLTALDNGNTVSITLNFGVLTFSGDVRPGDYTIDTQEKGDDVQIDFALQHDGVITKDSGTLDTGQEALVSSWFDETRLTTNLFEIPDGNDPATSDPLDGSTEYEGEAVVETVTLSAERASDLALDVDFAGDGALTRSTFTAV